MIAATFHIQSRGDLSISHGGWLSLYRAFCAATGWQVLGWMGAIAGVFALTAPTGVLAVLILQGFESGSSHPLVMAALGGTVAAVSGMMWSTVLLLLRRYAGRGWSQNARVIVIAMLTPAVPQRNRPVRDSSASARESKRV